MQLCGGTQSRLCGISQSRPLEYTLLSSYYSTAVASCASFQLSFILNGVICEGHMDSVMWRSSVCFFTGKPPGKMKYWGAL